MNPIIDMLVEENPLFHTQRDGKSCSWAGNTNMLKDVEKLLQPGMNTIETGAGYSTVIFLAKGCNHTTLTFDSREIERIKDFCRDKSISCESYTYYVGDSTETVSSVSGPFDFVFIDGAHRFPYPIIDWYNLNQMLKVNGILVVDDTDIISCHILVKYLLTDPKFELLANVENYAIFRKTEFTPPPGDWLFQPFSNTKIFNNSDILKVLGV